MDEPIKRPRAKGGSAVERRIIRLSSGCRRCQEPSCTGGCPIGVGIPSILSLASSGRLKDAAALMRLRSPFASITGRLCPSDRFCEHACMLGRKGAPVSIHTLESFLGDISLALPVKKGKTARGNVLVIGSGPAGLTVAHDLFAEGFMVTVYEKEPLLGGWLRSLPLEIIPPGILASEINRLALSGIVFETSRPFEALEGFPPKNYYAMVLATGAPGSTGKPFPIKRDNEGFIVIDSQYHTSRPCVYAAGGAIARFNCITEAMASARDMVGHLLRSYLFPPV